MCLRLFWGLSWGFETFLKSLHKYGFLLSFLRLVKTLPRRPEHWGTAVLPVYTRDKRSEIAFLPGVRNPGKIRICPNSSKMFQNLRIGPKKVWDTFLTCLEQEKKMGFWRRTGQHFYTLPTPGLNLGSNLAFFCDQKFVRWGVTWRPTSAPIGEKKKSQKNTTSFIAEIFSESVFYLSVVHY